MGQETVGITRAQEARLHRKLFRLATLVIAGKIPFALIMELLNNLFREYTTEGVVDDEPKKVHDLAEERRLEMEQFFRNRGFYELSVPKPNVSNRELARREKIGQQLFFMPISSQTKHDAFMSSVGQSNHWTVTDHAARAKIGWEFSKEGYWFWAEVAPNTPRIKISWDDLTSVQKIRLLSLEEYVIVWHAMRVETGVMLDVLTWCWLRTRFNGSGALGASGHDGRVGVGRLSSGSLSVGDDDGGGRSAEVV